MPKLFSQRARSFSVGLIGATAEASILIEVTLWVGGNFPARVVSQIGDYHHTKCESRTIASFIFSRAR